MTAKMPEYINDRFLALVLALAVSFSGGCSGDSDRSPWLGRYKHIEQLQLGRSDLNGSNYSEFAPSARQNIYADFSSDSAALAAGQVGKNPELNQLGDAAMDLDELINFALKMSPQLREKFDLWQAAASSAAASEQYLLDPMISYTHFIEKVETRTGSQQRSLMLSQKLPFWTRFDSSRDMAAASAARAYLQLLDARDSLENQLSQLYSEYEYLCLAADVSAQIAELLNSQLAAARESYSGGRISQQRLFKLNAAAALADQRSESFKTASSATAAELNAVAGRAVSAEISVKAVDDFYADRAPKPLSDSASNTAINPAINPALNSATRPATTFDRAAEIAPAVSRSIDELIERADMFNTQLAASRVGHDYHFAALHKAKSAYYPDVTISAGWVDSNPRQGMDVTHKGRDPVTVGVSMNLPLWHNRIADEVASARSSLSAAINASAAVEFGVAARLRKAVVNYNDARRRISLYSGQLLGEARSSLEITLTEFSSGASSYQQLNSAVETLLEFELNFYRARSDAMKNFYQLQYLTGADRQWLLAQHR